MANETTNNKRLSLVSYDKNVQPNLDKIVKWRSEGMTTFTIAKKLKISYGALMKYQREQMELRDALATGKKALTDNLEQTLYTKALNGESDNLLMFSLKSLKPRTYIDRVATENLNIDADKVNLTEEELKAIIGNE